MKNLRNAAFFAMAALITVSSSGQDRTTWRTAADIQEGVRASVTGTVADVDEARSQISVEADDDAGPRIVVLSDSVSTRYNGFGGVINGQPEIFLGSQGLTNVRVGDRVEVRGVGRGNNSIRADLVTLRGRPTPASQTGVGSSRQPSSVSTPTTTSTTAASRVGSVEGVVQELNAIEGRIVIVSDRREVMTVRASNATPVYYRNEVLRVANLEIGDRIRIEPDSGGYPGGELRARSIQVVKSVQEGSPAPRPNSLAGRVARIDRSIDIVTVDTGRTSVRVDVASASDSVGRRVRAADFQSGDHVEMTGRYSPTAADLFIAATVRFSDDSTPAPRPGTSPAEAYGTVPTASGELGVVTVYGTVRETLTDSPQLVVRDANGRTIRLNALDELAVRTKTGTYITADRLSVGDRVVVKAYRDVEGNYIAQVIRIR